MSPASGGSDRRSAPVTQKTPVQDAPGGRVGRVVRRWQLDGRLPEPAARRLVDTARLGARRVLQRACATVSPPAGWGHWVGASRIEGQWRRWVWAGNLDMPVEELAHDMAQQVVGALGAAGVDCTIAGLDGGRVHLAVDAADRSRAADALGRLDGAANWYVTWRRGHRHRTTTPGTWSMRHRAVRAESWEVFRWLRAAGHYGEGREQSVLVSFWAPGAAGRVERLGLRGLHRFDPMSPRTTEEVGGHAYPGRAAFPVGRALGRMTEPIDVVYTWVDGRDPQWRASFDEWSERGGRGGLEGSGLAATNDGQTSSDGTHPARYESDDELRYSLRALWLYAGWVRNVYLVTNGQVPDWLVPDGRLRVVTHDELFPHEWLPTFNSHAIEARLHHIDGLAEHFVYFNDDVLLARPVRPETFFTPNGLPLFFESEARIEAAGLDGGGQRSVDQAAGVGQALIRRDFGIDVVHKLDHAPHPLRRSVLAEIEQRYSAEVEATARHRFRHPDDLAIPSGFAAHYGYATGRAIPGKLHVGYQNLGGRNLTEGLRRFLWGRDFDALCINATEVWDVPPPVASRHLARFLSNYYPVPSPWEAAGATSRGGT